MLARRLPTITASHRVKTSQRISRRHLSLAYAKYSAMHSNDEDTHAPIVILHGLFGSKQNNRSISKYAAMMTCQFRLRFDCSRALARDLRRSVYALVSTGPNAKRKI